MRLFLRDILAEKRRRGDADAELFRRVASFEFAAGLNATAEGAAAAMRRWVDSRPAWVSDAQHAGRVAVLAVIEEAVDQDRREGGSSASLGVRPRCHGMDPVRGQPRGRATLRPQARE